MDVEGICLDYWPQIILGTEAGEAGQEVKVHQEVLSAAVGIVLVLPLAVLLLRPLEIVPPHVQRSPQHLRAIALARVGVTIEAGAHQLQGRLGIPLQSEQAKTGPGQGRLLATHLKRRV
ncbi:hypothetical protein Ancab_001764 [Ancistrocladus abbreviatus]